MTPAIPDGQTPASRVSILARVVPAFSYITPMLGAAMSAFMFFGLLRAMRYAEAAGVSAVAGGIQEANFPVIISLYFAVTVGFIGILVFVIRMLSSPTTASPSAWFFLVVGGLSFIPAALFWKGESILTETIAGRGNVALAASSIYWCLTLTIIATAAFSLISLIASLIPLPHTLRTKRNYAPLIGLVLMELALIGMAIGFQLHNSWLYQVRIRESL